MKEQLQIIKGLRFTSNHFRMTAEVHAVREDKNEIDVILTNSEGDAWLETNWNFQHVKNMFEKGDYKPKEKEISFGIF